MADHAICSAHLLRDLDKVGATLQQSTWTKDMTDLLLSMNSTAESARKAGKTKIAKKELKEYLETYNTILDEAFKVNPEPVNGKQLLKCERDSYNLLAALQKYKNEVTLFAKDLDVPFTNNEAKRSLRMVKLHKKISGCFKSQDAPQYFARIRSYLTTARKQNVSSLEVLTRLFKGNTWMPFQPSQAP